MCGIAGLYATEGLGPRGQSFLKRMTDVIAHRGPDDEGFLVDGPVALGMRRLSIIDLEGGRQPVGNEDGSLSVVFNGEIYNYRELRRELLAAGHKFITASDTEVLVHLYEEHGEECVGRLRGMFAFALWDRRQRSLFLARDRLGIKPLYYAGTPGGFVFGSELKAIRESPWGPGGVDRGALSAYLQCGYVPDPLAILEGVKKLPPGHTLTVRDGCPAAPRRYWEPAAFFRNHSNGLSVEETAEELWVRLSEAVRSHLVSDVPVGAFLSGGVDSSAVLAAMAGELGAPVKTFSIGFREDAFNELPYARAVAEWFGTEHYDLVVKPDDLGVLEKILAAFDEPFADASAIPTYLVSQLARQHVKVVLSGDGGDELFGGYDRYLVDHKRRFLGLLGDARLGAGVRALSAALPPGTPGKNYLYNLSLPRDERYVDSISIFRPATLRDLLGPVPQWEARSAFRATLQAGGRLDPLSRFQGLDLQTYLPGDILTKVDRMSMANSLEARVPLLDHPFVQFSCGIPPRLRLKSGATKFVLKRALRGRVPDEVLTRPKQGFAVPLDHWLGAGSRSFFRDRLEGARSVRDGYLNPSALSRILDLYEQTGRPEFRRQLWALVVFEAWYSGR